MSNRTVNIKVNVQEGELKRLRKVLRAVGADSPEITAAFERAVDDVLMPQLIAAAPGSMGQKIRRGKVSKASAGTAPRVAIKFYHWGVPSYEFGRQRWYRGWKGKPKGKGSIKALGGRPFRAVPGQPARPWIGVKGGGVLANAKPAFLEAIEKAIEDTWRRIEKQGAA